MRIATLSLPIILLFGCGDPEEDTGPTGPDPVLTIGPEAPCSTDPIVAVLEDGTAAAWSWTVAGEPADVSGDTVSADLTQKGQRWRVVVDVEETGRQLAAELIVKNCGPTIGTVALTPDAPTGIDPITATVDATDPDNDVLTYHYSWTVDGEEVMNYVSGYGTSEVQLEGLRRGMNVAVEVFASDGQHDTEAVSESVAIANTPPTTPGVAIVPDGPIIDDDLTCTVAKPSTDLDEDEIAYEVSWTVDGTPFTETHTTELTGDTVPYTATADQQVWACSIVASDGEAVSEAGSSEVLVVAWEGVREFTTCSATGVNGPSQSQCDVEYDGALVGADGLTVTGGVQVWTVNSTGRYRIDAVGAKGGGSGNYGRGAHMSGVFELEEGDELHFMIGQVGGIATSGGGGGGTFVMLDGETPLIVAGGGGGQYDTRSDRYNADASIETSGMGSGCTSGGSSGGGGSGCTAGGASGGGGWRDNGGTGSYGTGGLSYMNGGAGGDTSYTAVGAFGGGGGTHGNTGGGGGGGGYSGGAGGYHSGSTGAGGGGGSYNAGTDQVNEAGVGDGPGWASVDIE